MTVHRRTGGTGEKASAATASAATASAATVSAPVPLHRLWRAGEFLLRLGAALIPVTFVLVSFVNGSCETSIDDCGANTIGLWGVGLGTVCVLGGILILLVVTSKRAHWQTRSMDELLGAARAGDSPVTLELARARIAEPELAESIVGALAGLVAILLGIAVGPDLTAAVFDVTLLGLGIGTAWILPTIAALCGIAIWVDWRSARKRDRVLALVNPADTIVAD